VTFSRTFLGRPGAKRCRTQLQALSLVIDEAKPSHASAGMARSTWDSKQGDVLRREYSEAVFERAERNGIVVG
jgi:hypothetical protein